MKAPIRTLTLLTLVSLALGSCQGTQPPPTALVPEVTTRPTRTLEEIKGLLEPAMGGTWRIGKDMLRGHKAGEGQRYEFVCTVIPNPKTSDAGLGAAKMILWTWSSVQHVFAADGDHVLTTTARSISPAHREIAATLGMELVEPPEVLGVYLRERCNCVWDRRATTLTRTAPVSGQ